MTEFKTIMAIILTTPLLWACSEDTATESPQDDFRVSSALHIKRIGPAINNGSRVASLNYGAYFNDKDSIGISVKDAVITGSSYTSPSIKNVKYVAAGNFPTQTWSTANDIGLGKAPAHVSAYHPYDASYDPTNLNVDCATGVDWLYAKYDSWNTTAPLNYADPDVYMELRHAQSVFVIKVVNEGGYTFGGAKVGSIEEVGIGSNPIGKVFGQKGKLNSTDSTFSNITDTISAILPTTGPQARFVSAITTDTIIVDTFLVIPIENAADKDGKIRIRLKIDGTDKFAETTTVRSIERGKIYTFTLKFENITGTLILDDRNGDGGIEIEPWDNTPTVYPYLRPPV